MTEPSDLSRDARPRVVVWRSSLIRGSETFIRNQASALTRWRPLLLGIRRLRSPVSAADDHFVGGGGALNQQFARLWIALNVPRPGTASAVRALGAALLHVHFVSDAWLVRRAARRLDLPLVITAHGFDVTGNPNLPGPVGWVARRRARISLRDADLVIAVSGFIRDRVIALGAPADRVVVHHIGLPLPAALGERPTPEWDVAFVGRFVEKKGVLDLVRALSIVAPERPGLRAALIGFGPLREQAEALARSLGVELEFMGAQPPAEVARVLAHSRILAAPSKTAPNGDSEGLPIVILEGMAAGLPVVATRHSGIPEAVIEGETGRLVDEGDVERLAAELLALLASEAEQRRLGDAGRARVEQEFDIVRQTALLEELYDEAVATHRGREGVR